MKNYIFSIFALVLPFTALTRGRLGFHPMIFSIYAGNNFPRSSIFTIESMIWNPSTSFVLVNIANDSALTHASISGLSSLAKKANAVNFYVKHMTYAQFSDRVYAKLGYRVHFDESWESKLMDYKFALGHLFPEILENKAKKYGSNSDFSHWGYADFSVVWGNITRFQYTFDTRMAREDASKSFAIFPNREETKQIFRADEKFYLSLRDKNVPSVELMGGTILRNNIDNGSSSKSVSRFWATAEDSMVEGVPVVWLKGALHVTATSKHFSASHQLLFYLPSPLDNRLDLNRWVSDTAVEGEVIQDMLEFGFVLPNWVPLSSRHQCPDRRSTGAHWQPASAGMRSYSPFACWSESSPQNLSTTGSGSGGGGGGSSSGRAGERGRNASTSYAGSSNTREGGGGREGDGQLYRRGRRFPRNSTRLTLPRIVALSVHMGPVRYPHMRLTLASMRYNPQVNFVLINIVANPSRKDGDATPLINMGRSMGVRNFHVHCLSYAQFSARVEQRLNFTVNFDPSWYYKMTDYKPTLAHLFPEFVRRNSGVLYWGYVDLDLVWGNFSAFSYYFQGQFPVVTTDFNGATGVGMFFRNEDWTRRLFLEDPLFATLLQNKTDYQLDEFSLTPMYESSSMDSIIRRVLKDRRKGEQMNTGKNWKDKLWIEQEGAVDWAGAVRWQAGALRLVRATPEFPAGHEFLIFHRPEKNYDPGTIKVEEDMLTYGYLLPNWVPLMARTVCLQGKFTGSGRNQTMGEAMQSFAPFAAELCTIRNASLLPFGSVAGHGSLHPHGHPARNSSISLISRVHFHTHGHAHY